jgi:hypothetical protein
VSEEDVTPPDGEEKKENTCSNWVKVSGAEEDFVKYWCQLYQ